MAVASVLDFRLVSRFGFRISDFRHGRAGGHSLAGTLVFLVLVLVLWMAVFHQAASTLRTDKACQLRQDRSLGPTRALAWGLTLLETGTPPDSPYSCRGVLEPPTGPYVITFTKTGPAAYTVAVRPALPGDIYLPLAPPQFSATGGTQLFNEW